MFTFLHDIAKPLAEISKMLLQPLWLAKIIRRLLAANLSTWANQLSATSVLIQQNQHGDYKQNDIAMLACEQALLFGQAKRASRERASQGGRGGSTMMKGNLCIYKCFIDVLYIFDRFFKKKLGNAPDLRQIILLLIFAMCSADFTCGNGSWRCQCYVNCF